MSFLSIHPTDKGCPCLTLIHVLESLSKKGRMVMIQIKTLDGKKVGIYQDYEELFEHIVEHKNLKLIAKKPNFKDMNWSFVVYQPVWVAYLYNHRKPPCDAVREAFERELPLIEICTGDYKNPRYIVMTPNTDLLYFKKQWCRDYCTFHDLVVQEI